jgi:drug/metabolite transporter (DMT)-like permease
MLGGERPGWAPVLGIVAGVAAVALVGQAEPPAGAGAPVPPRGSTRHLMPVALASGIFIGLFLVGLGRIGKGSGLAPLVLARGAGTLLLGLAAVARRTDLRPVAAQWRVVLGCGACDVGGNLLYMLAAQRAPLSLVAPLVSLAPASTVVLAQLVLHERLGRAQKAGVALALLAVALLAQGTAH